MLATVNITISSVRRSVRPSSGGTWEIKNCCRVFSTVFRPATDSIAILRVITRGRVKLRRPRVPRLRNVFRFIFFYATWRPESNDGEALTAQIKRRTNANCFAGISGAGPSFGRRKKKKYRTFRRNSKRLFPHTVLSRGVRKLVTVFYTCAYRTYINGAVRVYGSTVHNDSIGRYDVQRVFARRTKSQRNAVL